MRASNLLWRLADWWPFATPRSPDRPFGGWGPQAPLAVVTFIAGAFAALAYVSGYRLVEERDIRLVALAREVAPNMDRLTDDEARRRLRAYGGVIELLQTLTEGPLPHAEATAVEQFSGRPVERYSIRRIAILIDFCGRLSGCPTMLALVMRAACF